MKLAPALLRALVLLVLFGDIACGGAYPTPARGIQFTSNLTGCLDAGSRAAFDTCEKATIANYCSTYPALQICETDGGAE